MRSPAVHPSARLAGLGVRFKIDSTSIGNDHDAAMQKSHDEAKEGHAAPEANSEKVSDDLARMTKIKKVSACLIMLSAI